MEIYLDKRAVRQLRLSASDALEECESDSLREDLFEIFDDEQVEELERRIDSGDIHDFISLILGEWSLEDVEELFELLEQQLSEADVDLKYQSPEEDDDEDDDEEETEGEVEYDDDAL